MGENIKRVVLNNLNLINQKSNIKINKVIDCQLAIIVNYTIDLIPFSFIIWLDEMKTIKDIFNYLLVSMYRRYIEYVEENRL